MEPGDFSKFVSQQYQPPQHDPIVQQDSFVVSEKEARLIQRALAAAPKGKAAGPDQLFAEGLQVSSHRTGAALVAL